MQRTEITGVVLALGLLVACSGEPATGPAEPSDWPDVVQVADEGPEPQGDLTGFHPIDAGAPDTGPAAPVVVIEKTFPDRGHTWGGETIAVIGTGFLPGARVLFDGVMGSTVVFVDDTRLHVTTPPHGPAAATVVVVNTDKSFGELEGGFLYYNEVSVASLEPGSGPAFGGTPITVSGVGFAPDSRLIVGQHEALATKVLDDTTILALSPPGAAGPADVIVSNHLGVYRLNDGFYYQAGVTVGLAAPAAGPTAGGQAVEVHGSGFAEPVKVWFGSSPATDVVWLGNDRLVMHTPAGQGVVDVRVDSAEGSGLLLDGYLFTDETSDQLELIFASPGQGVVTGGTEVALTMTWVGDDATVLFDGQLASLLSTDAESATIRVKTPAGAAPGLVDLLIETEGESVTSPDAFEYVQPLTISSLAPNAGPVEGGTTVVLTGSGFDSPAVFVGALPAAVQVDGPDQLTIITPPGTPGVVDVRVIDGDRQAIMPKGFSYVSESIELYVVVPDHGAIAGGTWVQIIGAGFEADTEVSFGDEKATSVNVVTPAFLTVRTPPGKVGTVDVTVESGGSAATLEHAFTYYDPKSTWGGTWGGEVDVAVNLTVLDGTDAKPVMDAFVILDNEPLTPYQGFTNLKGQITFSGPDLGGAHTISVSKEGYITYSVVHFDAENLTVFLKRLATPEMSFDGVAPGIVQGKVHGLGKYVVALPTQCKADWAFDPNHCKPCADDDDCGETGAVCTDHGTLLGTRCLAPCEIGGDACPDGSICAATTGTPLCTPVPGQKVAVCSGTKPFFRFFDVPLGPGAMADAEGVFTIITFPTEIAVVCFGGLWLGSGEPTASKLESAIKSNPSGKFHPMVMGTKRHLLMEPGSVETDIEVELNIPLNRTVHVRMEKPPLDDTDYLWSNTYLDLATDGVIKMPVVRYLYDDEPFVLDALPGTFEGDIFDASFTFYSGANSWTNSLGYSYPRAWVVRQGVTEPQDDRMLRRIDGLWETTPTGLTESLQGAWAYSATEAYAVGTGGSIVRYAGGQHVFMPTDTSRTLRGVHGTGVDDAWAVGDGGVALHFDGLAWAVSEIGTEKDLRDVRVESDGTLRIVGNQVVLVQGAGGGWTDEPGPAGSWYALDSSAPDNVWMVGDSGWVRHWDGATAALVDTPTAKALRSVAVVSPTDAWIGGEGGLLLHWNGTAFEEPPSLTDQTIDGLDHRGPNEVLAVGNFGTVLSYDGDAWVPQGAGDYVQDLHAVALPDDSSAAWTFGDHQLILGPIVAPARVDEPVPGGLFEGDTILWTADDRVRPHYQIVEILVPGLFAPVVIWELVADGDIGAAPLPDFESLAGTPGLQDGQHYLKVTRVYQEGFDIDQFDYTDLGSLDRQSWAIEYFPFTTPIPEEEPSE